MPSGGGGVNVNDRPAASGQQLSASVGTATTSDVWNGQASPMSIVAFPLPKVSTVDTAHAFGTLLRAYSDPGGSVSIAVQNPLGSLAGDLVVNTAISGYLVDLPQ